MKSLTIITFFFFKTSPNTDMHRVAVYFPPFSGSNLINQYKPLSLNKSKPPGVIFSL